MSQGSVLAPKMGPKWVPNRIIDAEGIKQPFDRHLGGYHSALRRVLGALGRILRSLGTLLGRLEAKLRAKMAPSWVPRGRFWEYKNEAKWMHYREPLGVEIFIDF